MLIQPQLLAMDVDRRATTETGAQILPQGENLQQRHMLHLKKIQIMLSRNLKLRGSVGICNFKLMPEDS